MSAIILDYNQTKSIEVKCSNDVSTRLNIVKKIFKGSNLFCLYSNVANVDLYHSMIKNNTKHKSNSE